ncbi:Protein of unknown function [Mycobacterium canettii CIPT 140070010]|nr:Protein of unknown function [Mycobacterium canettii CIPT 140070010]
MRLVLVREGRRGASRHTGIALESPPRQVRSLLLMPEWQMGFKFAGSFDQATACRLASNTCSRTVCCSRALWWSP